MQEEILIKRYRSGTTIHYFNTDITPNNYSTSTVPAILKLGSPNNVPIELHAFDGVSLTGDLNTVLWKRNEDVNWYNSEIKMNYVHDTYLPNINYITGRTFSETIQIPIAQLSFNTLKERFINSMNEQFTAGTTTYVFAESVLIDDAYVNIKLEKTFDVLDTLSIYNKVTSEYPTRESLTGVVFGKLEAVQKITDSNGNKIRIPLRNVPIGVFVPSDDFQSPTDTDTSGNRIRLNYRPPTSTEQTYPTEYQDNYFNIESSIFDNNFLIDTPFDGIDIHPTFSNVVYTNENGEFFIHNVDVGSQVLFFEVDLLKQGLTKDEVALNFFPYPPNYENISIDSLPHYFYRAIPIDVVPSWGTSYQTGYTEVNISVNLDLRKWATYIIPPVTYKGYPIDSADYYGIFSRAPLSVQVRDMSKFDEEKLQETDPKKKIETYPSKGVQMVVVSNILDKNSNQQWEWSSEFSQIKDKALFFNYGFNAIKLPANIYDDESYKTDKYGHEQVGQFSKGVWICGYQLKLSLTRDDRLYRTTGMALAFSTQNNSWYDRDHFHCSLYDNIEALRDSGQPNSYSALAEGLELNRFPYERAWTKNYPEKYKIPKLPESERYSDIYSEREYMESPEFSDGEIIYGNSWLNNGNGFNGPGLSWFSLVEQYTDFSTDIIGGNNDAKMYKYERVGAEPFGSNQYFGCYMNGFYDGLGGVSSNVLNGERFQRVEAGYGYFLYPSSMPRIAAIPSGLFGYIPSEVDTSDINQDYKNAQNKGFLTKTEITMGGWWKLTAQTNHYTSYSVLRRSKSIAMDLSKKQSPSSIINDKLNIYRIVDAVDRLPYEVAQKVVPTFIQLVIDKMYFTNTQNKNNRMNLRTQNESYYTTKSNYFEENQQNPSSIVPNSFVWIDIENAGDVEQILEIWSDDNSLVTHNLNPGEKVRYYSGEDFNANTEDYNTYFRNFKIKAYGNAEFNEAENRYSKVKMKFTTSAEWNGYLDNDDNMWLQKVRNLHIRKSCSSEICSFDALDSITTQNTWYADTVWKGIEIDYYEIDGTNGYPKNDNHEKYVGKYCNVLGMFYNPGYFTTMIEETNGNTKTTGSAQSHKRLQSNGSMAFYWSPLSYKQRYNPNLNANIPSWVPIMSIGYPTNFSNTNIWPGGYWGTKSCCMRIAGQQQTPSGCDNY